MAETKTISEDEIFISKVKTTGNSLNVTIPIDICDFCEIKDGDLVKFKILKIKKRKK
jgi:antitoxin component of MazEF toxin-antitoxin module